MDDQNQIIQLFHKYINDGCTPQEIQQLMEYFDNPTNEEILKDLIMKTLASGEPGKNNGTPPGIIDKTLQKLLQQIKERMKR